MSINKIIKAIDRYDSFLITSHIGLEGDALGSELALAYLLKKKGKNAVIVNEDGVPQNYMFLEDKRFIKPLYAKIKKPEAVFILDCSDMSRCGKVSGIMPQDAPLVSIDHHISNMCFGDINWVEAKSSSTGEMIYKLYKKMNIPFERKAAICLYTAILTDTGSFRYSATSSYTHQAAAELLKFNIAPDDIYKKVYECNSYSDIIMFKKALDTLTIDDTGKIAWLKMDMDLPDSQSCFDQTDNVMDFARRIKDIRACFLLRRAKNKNEVRVNLRSKGNVDVSKVARFFGGGGHRNASGCTVKGSFAEVESLVFKQVKKAIK
ncbi:MAG: hypothetical protein COV72_09150 [Candidatus Omnitrophica bacterium CG11_big_fil_rev_8_21_14_0_20_42_13]|uniref:DHH family phosphoesterase n=1 Tax=Candidatus Ghiorseimicrobium undicola TaxID=1974746 RepID=A0A2H0LV12_9BACT|nr:MAG: hypothetical protein COV72_09150 [Candidatus Omnitrophica bacterium CG11_big_fil_rev_8_21_14_0_20_42_13]